MAPSCLSRSRQATRGFGARTDIHSHELWHLVRNYVPYYFAARCCFACSIRDLCTGFVRQRLGMGVLRAASYHPTRFEHGRELRKRRGRRGGRGKGGEGRRRVRRTVV